MAELPHLEASPAGGLTRHLPTVLVIGGGLATFAVPGVPAGVALAAGVAIALTVGNPHAARTRWIVKRLLPLSLVALGGGMDLAVVARVGVRGIGYTIATLALCAVLGLAFAAALRVQRTTGLLITIGTAICGGSAIAAAAPVVGADEHETSVALGTVFLLNSVALFVFPAVGHGLGLPQASFGLWSALAIHDTSSVVGATLRYGPQALVVGTTVKLARALWIVPATLGLGLAVRRGRTAARGGRLVTPPWFIAGFVAFAAIVTFWHASRPLGMAAASLGQRALVLTLFLIGLGLSRASLRSVGPRPLALGLALWAAMGAATLAALQAGLLHP